MSKKPTLTHLALKFLPLATLFIELVSKLVDLVSKLVNYGHSFSEFRLFVPAQR